MYQAGIFKYIWIWFFGGDPNRGRCAVAGCMSMEDLRCEGGNCTGHCQTDCKNNYHNTPSCVAKALMKE